MWCYTKHWSHSSPVRSRGVNLDPIKADININKEEKLSGTSSSTYVIGFRIAGDQNYADGINFSTLAFHLGRVRQVKSAEAYNAMADKGYDVLVHPTYNIKVERGLFVQKYQVMGVSMKTSVPNSKKSFI